MKSALRSFCRALVAMTGVWDVSSAVITWDGGGGNSSWQNRTNWSGDVLPAAGDAVLIDAASGVTIMSTASVTIASIQCSNSILLGGGIFRVTSGASVIQGEFSTTGLPTLAASGSNTIFTVVGTANANGMNFEALGGAILDFPGLTNLTAANITLTGGAMLSAPNLRSYNQGSICGGKIWAVTGTGSMLRLPSLTNIMGALCIFLSVEVGPGGSVVLTNLRAISQGTVRFFVDGTNSTVDLSGLRQYLETPNAGVYFEARNGGAIHMPEFPGGPQISVSLARGGAMSVAQMTRLQGITVEGMAVDFPALTNLYPGIITVTSGAVVTAPNLRSCNLGNYCSTSMWKVSGAGSELRFSALTNLTGNGCFSGLTIQALAGGTVNFSNVVTIGDGALIFSADGSNSMVNLAALERSLAMSQYVYFEARNRGTIWVPVFTGGPTVSVIIRPNTTMPVAAMTRLREITVSGAVINFTGLTNFDGGRIAVSDLAVVTASNLSRYYRGTACVGDSWVVSGAGAVLDLPGLLVLSGGTCASLDVLAMGGGHLLMRNLSNISDGNVSTTSDGIGSLIDLRGLSNSLNPLKLTRLVTTNGGTILFSEEPFVVSGVSINFAPGTPNLPPLALGATNLIFHGRPWHSYWMERRNSPDAPWVFLRRVPVTNDFQIIGPAATANTEFRIFEFVADPYTLELTRVDPGVHLVLYAPTNRTFEVQARTNLSQAVVWETFDTVTMTNSFRIFPPEPQSTPQRYFKANPL